MADPTCSALYGSQVLTYMYMATASYTLYCSE